MAGLLGLKSKVVTIEVVKFYKALIKSKDEMFAVYLTRKQLLDPVVKVFKENNGRENMVHSVVMEMFEYLTKEPNKKLNGYIMDKYQDTLLSHPSYSRFFKSYVSFCQSGTLVHSPHLITRLSKNSFNEPQLSQRRDQLLKDNQSLLKAMDEADPLPTDDYDLRYMQRGTELLTRRKSSSSGGESSEEEEDMGLFGRELA